MSLILVGDLTMAKGTVAVSRTGAKPEMHHFFRQRVRDRRHLAGEEPAERRQLPDPQPGRRRPPSRGSRHAPGSCL